MNYGIFTRRLQFEDMPILVMIVMVTTILWWPTRNLPFHWDSAGFVAPYAEYLYQHNLQIPLDRHLDFTHPPGYMYLLALAWMLLGKSLLVGHLISLVMGVFFLYGSYRFASFLLGRYAGLLVLLGLLTSGLVIGQLGMMYQDLSVAALGIWGLFCVERRNYARAGILFMAGILVKETVVGFVVYSIVVLFLRNDFTLKRLFYLLLPVFSYITWLLLHKYLYGYYWYWPGYGGATLLDWSVEGLFTILSYQIKELLGWHGRVVLVMAALWGVAAISIQKKIAADYESFYWLFVAMMGVIGFLTLGGQVHAKYMIIVLPILYILAVWGTLEGIGSLLRIVIGKQIFAGFLVFCFMLFSVSGWYSYDHNLGYIYEAQERNLTYQDMQKNWIEMAAFIEKNYSDSLVLGDFPENVYLTQSFQGYVTTPVREFVLCKDYVETHSEDESYILVRHMYTPHQASCENLLDTVPSLLLARFERRDWNVDVYGVGSDFVK